MALNSYYEDSYASVDEIPSELIGNIAPIILDRLPGGNAELFLELRDGLPKIYDVLCNKYRSAVIGRTQYKDDNIIDILIPSTDWYLLGDVSHSADFQPGCRDSVYYMLPGEIRAYYFLVQSLQLIKGSADPAFSWHGLPNPKFMRQSLTEYRTQLSLPKKVIPKNLEKERMFVWMRGSQGEVLVINDRDGQFYRGVMDKQLEVFPIDNPVDYWDSYCSYVLSTGDIDGPLFRD